MPSKPLRQSDRSVLVPPERLTASYDWPETHALVDYVAQAASLVEAEGEVAFTKFRDPSCSWREGERYLFVIDLEGRMLVHPDPSLEGHDTLELRDMSGKSIIRGILAIVTAPSARLSGWYHYQWTVPGGILPRWKSTYVRRVTSPSGKEFVVGSGLYNDGMERAFVVDWVDHVVSLIEESGIVPRTLLHDRSGPFLAKDSYVFVFDMNGVALVNPGFPLLEGKNLWDAQDSQGKPFIQEMISQVQQRGSGWVDYFWPRPGESFATQKSAYVAIARTSGNTYLVGSGIYLENAPRMIPRSLKKTARDLMELVRDAAACVQSRGEGAFSDFRTSGSKWFHDDTAISVWDREGRCLVHSPDPSVEGHVQSQERDAVGRPIGQRLLDIFNSSINEDWIHDQVPRSGELWPSWRSRFFQKTQLPSGKEVLVGSAAFDLRLEAFLVENLVNQAVEQIRLKGRDAFNEFRNLHGRFAFMDVYIFVQSLDGIERVNPVFPSLEGRSLFDLQDAEGHYVIREQLNAVAHQDSAWLRLSWYRPGSHQPAVKRTFIRKIRLGAEDLIVGSGIYLD